MVATNFGVNRDGFTVVEVLMFLAISGLLLLGAMAGVNANINNTRFNDAIHSTTSYIQGQVDQVTSGINDRSSTLTCDTALNINTGSGMAPGMATCAVFGRFLMIQGDRVESRYIVGYSDKAFNTLIQDDLQSLNDPGVRLRVAPSSVYSSSFSVPWSIAMTRAKTPSLTPTSLGVAIIRSPVSGSIMFFSFNANGAVEPSLAGVFIQNNLNKNVIVCYKDDSSSRLGNITFSPGKGQDVIATDLTDTAGDCS